MDSLISCVGSKRSRCWSTVLKQTAFLIPLLIIVIGCGSNSMSQKEDIDPDALYTFGASREDLETRFGPGTFFWILDEVPKDQFAAASIKAEVAIRRPRPAAYEVFIRRSAGPGAKYFHDYVFYNDRLLVLYTARRNPN
jgi:hypothetical protein